MKPAQLPKIRSQILADSQDPALGDSLGPLPGRLATADLFLVTEPMTRMALDASRDVPEQTFSALWPHPSGIMAFDGGLPPLDGNLSRQFPGASVITWCAQDDLLWLSLWTRTNGEGIIFQSGARRRTVAVGASWFPVGTYCLPHTNDYRWTDYDGDADSGALVAVFSLLLTTWHLMQIPTVAEVVERREAGAKLGNGKRDLPRQVKVVDLRRLARRPDGDDEPGSGSKVQYRHQWVVRGHWRQQPHGKGRVERRTQWVPSYLKGPEGAPFLPSESVFVWRR